MSNAEYKLLWTVGVTLSDTDSVATLLRKTILFVLAEIMFHSQLFYPADLTVISLNLLNI